MKTKKPPQKAVKRTSKKRPTSKHKGINLVHDHVPILRHFRLVERKHTCRLIHFKFTSHLTLIGILIITGFFMLISVAEAAANSSGSITIGAIVPGPPPDVGAVITSPKDGAEVRDQNTIEVSGTCLKETFVVVSDNKIPVGSTNCSDAGIFVVRIQIEPGKNVLTALNYDNLNQKGPKTPSVTITMSKSIVVIPTQTFVPSLPSNPSVVPGVNTGQPDCSQYSNQQNLPTGGEPHVLVACVPRLFLPNTEQIIGLLVWGGIPPYALGVNWSEDPDDIKIVSIAQPGYVTQTVRYAFPGIYKVEVKLTDKKGSTAVVQTSVQANGVSPQNSITPILQTLKDNNMLSSSVPYYLLAVAITIGFWGGDIFDRKFGAGRVLNAKRIHRTVKS